MVVKMNAHARSFSVTSRRSSNENSIRDKSKFRNSGERTCNESRNLKRVYCKNSTRSNDGVRLSPTNRSNCRRKIHSMLQNLHNRQ